MSPLAALGLAPGASVDEIRGAWRQLASIHHPDRGGDAAEFHRLREAYNQAMAEAEAPQPCTICGGRGSFRVQSGWSYVNMPCTACDGTGATT